MADDGHESSPQKKRSRAASCYGCRQEILDQYILQVAPDMEWHASCLKCVECQQFLDESCTCFVKDRKTYCKRDYLRLFAAKCAKCSQSFNKNDFVMRARNKIYHTDCFCCVVCSRQLVSGDEFALRDDGLFCKSDHEVMGDPPKSGRLELTMPGFGSGGGRSPSRSHGDINGNSISPGSNSNASSTGPLQSSGNAEPMQSNHSHRHHRESSGRSHVHKSGSEHKPTRVRTVLNEKQLLTLRTCYNANPRPDALMKEQLVEMTNLSPRVIRVWFQNKRCKDKKRNILMKQMAQQEKFSFGARTVDSDYSPQSSPDGRQLQNIVNMRGVPLVAGSPIRHESPVQHPIEVQSYHPPWKAFADYALQSDIDPNGPHFQHLVSQMHGYDHMPPGPLPPGGDPHLAALHGLPPNGPCTPLSYLEHDLHNPHSNLSSQIPGTPSEMSSPCTSE